MSLSYYILLTYAAGAIGFAAWMHYLVMRDEHRLYLGSPIAYVGLLLSMLIWPVCVIRWYQDF